MKPFKDIKIVFRLPITDLSIEAIYEYYDKTNAVVEIKIYAMSVYRSTVSGELYQHTKKSLKEYVIEIMFTMVMHLTKKRKRDERYKNFEKIIR